MIARSASFRAESFSPSRHKRKTALRKEEAVWLISVEWFKCFARLFSGNLCASRIASKALRESQQAPDKRPFRTQKQSGIEPVGLAAIEWPHRNFVQVSTE